MDRSVRLGVQLAATSLMAGLTLACAPGGDVGGLPEAKEGGGAGTREGGGSSTGSGAPSGRDAAGLVGDAGRVEMCEVAATRCAGNGLETCGASGQWSQAVGC